MASNSFRLKAWFLVSFSALFTFFAKWDSKAVDDLVWIVPLFFFAGLDAYYLKQERIFRLVHNDFETSLNGGKENRKPFDFTPTNQQRREFNILNCLFSPSVLWLYFPLINTYWLFVGFHTLHEGWGKWLVLLGLPIASAIGVLLFRKETNHSNGKPLFS